MGVMLLVNATGLLRVSQEGESYGLDLHEHGISAYPEYVISSLAAPSGMAAEAAKLAQPSGVPVVARTAVSEMGT
jgi:Amt family ammonium transporter